MYDSLERTYLNFVAGKSNTVTSTILNIFLTPLSWIYFLIITLRNWAYDYGVFKVRAAAVPAVISVGNIVAGGTGKTPVAMMLARDLLKKFPVAILSRGYRSHAENLKIPLILSNGQGPEYPVNLCGDEPYMIAENIPEARIFVGKDRFQSAQMAANRGAKLVILDDGMQHRQLARDFELVVMDANDLFGSGNLLPKGLLREPLSSLKRADILILNNVKDSEHYSIKSNAIRKYTTAPIVGTRVKVTMIKNLDGSPINSLKDKRIGMLCGIGSPDNFRNTLEEMGADIVDTLLLIDHGAVHKNKLARFVEKCDRQGVDYIVCTEKDKVKLENISSEAIPLVWIKIDLEISDGINDWKDFLKKTVQKVNTNKG